MLLSRSRVAACGCAVVVVAGGCAALVDFPDVPSAGVDAAVGNPKDATAPDARRVGAHDATTGHDAHARDASRASDARRETSVDLDAGPDATMAPCPGTRTDMGCLVTLAEALVEPTGIALDTHSVYWTNYGALSPFVYGSVMKMPKVAEDGGGATTLSPKEARPLRILVLGDTVYWADIGDAAASPTGTLSRISTDGGHLEVLVPRIVDPLGLAANGATVYASDNASGGPTILYVSPDGGGAGQDFATVDRLGTAWAMAIDDAGVYWTTDEVDGGQVWLWQAPSAARPLATKQLHPWALVARAGRVYWGTRGIDGGAGPTIASIAILGEVAPDILERPDGGFPYALAVDDTSLYWTDIEQNLVVKVPLAGGAPVTLAVRADASGPCGIAVDDASVYWTEVYGGRLMKLTPK